MVTASLIIVAGVSMTVWITVQRWKATQGTRTPWWAQGDIAALWLIAAAASIVTLWMRGGAFLIIVWFPWFIVAPIVKYRSLKLEEQF